MKQLSVLILLMISVVACTQKTDADSTDIMYRLDSLMVERDGNICSKEVYIYNEDDKEILTTRFSWNEKKKVWEETSKVEYMYDTNKNTITSIFYYENGMCQKDERIYDTNKNLIMHTQFWNDSTYWIKLEVTEYIYDDNNKLKQGQRQDFSYKRKFKVEYQYNDNGDSIMKIWYKGNLSDDVWRKNYKYEYVYDTNGNQIKEVQYSWEKNAWKIYCKDEWLYDTNRDIIEYAYYDNEKNILKKVSKTEYEYNKKANTKTYIHSYLKNNVWINQSKHEYLYSPSLKAQQFINNQ